MTIWIGCWGWNLGQTTRHTITITIVSQYKVTSVTVHLTHSTLFISYSHLDQVTSAMLSEAKVLFSFNFVPLLWLSPTLLKSSDICTFYSDLCSMTLKVSANGQISFYTLIQFSLISSCVLFISLTHSLICLYLYTTHPLHVLRLLYSLHILASVNKTAMNIGVHITFLISVFKFSREIQVVELLDLMVDLLLKF